MGDPVNISTFRWNTFLHEFNVASFADEKAKEGLVSPSAQFIKAYWPCFHRKTNSHYGMMTRRGLQACGKSWASFKRDYTKLSKLLQAARFRGSVYMPTMFGSHRVTNCDSRIGNTGGG